MLHIVPIPRFHIGILSDSTAGPRVLSDRIPFWITEFLASPYNGGIHVVTNAPITGIDLPQLIVPDASQKVSSRQAHKRCQSLRYFLHNTTAPYFLFITHDTFLFPRNLRYLVGEIMSSGFDMNSNFVLGQCMFNAEGSFLHGSAYVHSREAARRAIPPCDVHADRPGRSEDVGYRNVMSAIGISVFEGSSAFRRL
jgi:hypothetical protein